MHPRPVLVFLPCHTLDDFPSWLDDAEADALLAAWTAAWHPAVIAAAGSRPIHASVDLPPPSEARAGIVPGFCEDRFSAQVGPDDCGRWVRDSDGVDASARALASILGTTAGEDESLPGETFAELFSALGLATLIAELLAVRMRTEPDLSATGFDAAVVAAAQAAVAGDANAARMSLDEAFACLDASRARYYPVDSWAIDLVLAAPSTSASVLVEALTSPVPAALVATGATIRKLAERSRDALATLRESIASGRVEACGGRDDERPLDAGSPEEIVASFRSGRQAWLDHLGISPRAYAAIAGGASAILPQVLAGFDYSSAVWSLFDGTPLPDPGGSRIRWEDGGAAIEAIGRPPLDASQSRTILQLPDTLGDAFDHDHTAVVQFACYAGTASRWHRLLRVIASRCTLLGSFVTPSTLVERSAGTGMAASFEPDAFLPCVPPEDASSDPVAAAAIATRTEATRLAAALDAIAEIVGKRGPSAATTTAASPRASAARRPAPKNGWLARLAGRRRDDDARSLENGQVRLVAHPRTGGMLSLRRPVDRGNRVSQQLALRTTGPVEGSVWSAPEDRGVWTRMEADAIDLEGGGGDGSIVSRGRLIHAGGKEAGTFRQRMTLVPGLPLAILDIEVSLRQPLAGPVYESHVACRFAWHENEEVEIYRSLHLQAVATERTRFTAPHFIEIMPALSRTGPGSGGLTILTGGLPWHLRTSPHVLDSVLAGHGAARASVRLAVGIGIDRPWDQAIMFTAGGGISGETALGPGNVRVAAGLTNVGKERPGSLGVSLVESSGRAGEVRLDWGRPIARAVAVNLDGRPLPDVHVAVDGQATVVFLHRYQWLHLMLDFEHS